MTDETFYTFGLPNVTIDTNQEYVQLTSVVALDRVGINEFLMNEYAAALNEALRGSAPETVLYELTPFGLLSEVFEAGEVQA